MDYDHKKEISFEKYVKALEKDPNLLEIYDFMNNSFNNNILGQSLNNSTTELKEFMIDIKNLEYNLEKLNKYLNKNHHLNDKNLSIFSENSPLNKKHHDYSININPKKSLLIDLNQNKISSEFEAKQFFSAKLDNKEPNQIHFSFSNMNSPNSNTKIRTFQKIDENVKKLLLKANLEKSPGLNSQENKNENLLINEITERHVAQPVRNFSEMTKFFQEKHKAIFHKIEEKLSEESDIFGESEFSEENKSKKDVFQSCLSIDSPKVNSPIMKKEESKELFPYFIEELHMQAKNLREQIEKKLKRNKLLIL